MYTCTKTVRAVSIHPKWLIEEYVKILRIGLIVTSNSNHIALRDKCGLSDIYLKVSFNQETDSAWLRTEDCYMGGSDASINSKCHQNPVDTVKFTIMTNHF